MNRTIKLVLEYEGTHFSGWQVQPERRTVQGVVEDALERILRQPVRITAAGRTDTGVHASGQVASLEIRSHLDMGRLARALNGVLPRDVTVVDCSEVRPGFNARFDAVARTYRYTLSGRRLSIGNSYAWHVKYSLNRELLVQSTRPLCGLCNLRGFSKGSDEQDYSTIIDKNVWTFDDELMIFEIRAVRFFHHAVRSIVGSAVEVARCKEPPDLLEKILETGDRAFAGPTAPACGLCLFNVDYGKEP